MRRGNCYVATEALWHILGGKRSDWWIMRMRTATDTHWFLRHRCSSRLILDPSRRQFGRRLPDYSKAKRTGFLTRRPSKRARALMRQLTWQEVQ